MSDEELEKTPESSMAVLEEFMDTYALEVAHLETVMADADGTCPPGTPKLDADFSGYMELEGAEKDGRCKIVDGGISKEKGCCNLFHPASGAERFNCGACKYLGSDE